MTQPPSSHATQAQIGAAQWLSDLSDASLLGRAGVNAFERAQVIAREGAVEKLRDLPPTSEHLLRIEAQVWGTQRYRTQLEWRQNSGQGLSGYCSCPVGVGLDFCKHQVALAIVWRTRKGFAQQTGSDGNPKMTPTAKRVKTKGAEKAQLLAFVKAQHAADLSALLWRMAEHDCNVMLQLKTWRLEAMPVFDEAGGDWRAAKAAVRDCLENPKGFLHPRDCAPYQRRAEQAFEIIKNVLNTSAELARGLCEDMLTRLYKVFETADDSWGGEMGDLNTQAIDCLKACLRASPPPAHWLDTWLTLAAKDPHGASDLLGVVQAAGPDVAHAYSAKAAREWQEVAHLSGHKLAYDHPFAKRRSAYLADLAVHGEDAVAFEVMKNSATSSWEWHELVAWCVQRKRWSDAFGFAKTAYAQHPHDRRIESDVLAQYERHGDFHDALAIHSKRLEREPGAAQYLATLAAAQRAGQNAQTYRQKLMDWAQANEHKAGHLDWRSEDLKGKADVSVRVRWLFEAEGDVLAASQLAQTRGVSCNADLLLALAKQLPQTHHHDAKVMLLRVFESAMPHASSPYSHVLEVVHLTAAKMTPNDRALWLSSLRMQYKAKRNFIKELPAP